MADYSNSKLEITRLSDRIYCIRPYEGVELEVEDALELRRVCSGFSGGNEFAVLLDATNDFSSTAEARALIASKEFTDLRIAFALVTNSLANKLAGNFFIRFNKPASATKLFTDKEEAFLWLQKQVVSFLKK